MALRSGRTARRAKVHARGPGHAPSHSLSLRRTLNFDIRRRSRSRSHLCRLIHVVRSRLRLRLRKPLCSALDCIVTGWHRKGRLSVRLSVLQPVPQRSTHHGGLSTDGDRTAVGGCDEDVIERHRDFPRSRADFQAASEVNCSRRRVALLRTRGRPGRRRGDR